MEYEEHPIQVTFTFHLPEHEEDMKLFQKGRDYYCALFDIYNECRTVWKYEENPSKDKVEFAERISQLVLETGVME